MIKAKALPVILRTVSKLELKPIIERLKKVDLKSVESGALSKEDQAILAFEVFSEFLPQLGKIDGEILQLIADCRDITIKEASELNIIEALQGLLADEDLMAFIQSLMKKSVQ